MANKKGEKKEKGSEKPPRSEGCIKSSGTNKPPKSEVCAKTSEGCV